MENDVNRFDSHEYDQRLAQLRGREDDLQITEVTRSLARVLDILRHFEDGQARYRHDYTFHVTIDALAHGRNPLVVIDHLLSQNKNLRDELQERIASQSNPLSHA